MQLTTEYLNFLLSQVKKHAKKGLLQKETTIQNLETLLETLENIPPTNAQI